MSPKIWEKFALSVRTLKISGEFALSVLTVSVPWFLLVQKRSGEKIEFLLRTWLSFSDDKSTSSPYVVDSTVLYRPLEKRNLPTGRENAGREGGHVREKTPSSSPEIKLNRTRIKLD